ncbi:MAG: pantetheine-phosphate adenylyltransferase [Bacillota bacterium]
MSSVTRRGLYPGSFDPVTNGHLDIIVRAARLFDELLVTVFLNANKQALFGVDERAQLLREVTAHIPNVLVGTHQGLLSRYASQQGALTIVKGLRAVSDFEAEFQMALMNRKLEGKVETMFMMTASEYAFISSSLVKEVARFGGCLDGLVPPLVAERLRVRFAGGGDGS